MASTSKSGSTKSGRKLVKVENDDGRLRLRWNYEGKRYAMAVGLPDTAVNRTFAKRLFEKF
ncbi:Arm DNA-binding domain-containing protein [Acaryochloris marina]|uniref:Arm DNA-binding domain-containing protein n=1 Tax=Acaryochloris marina TaxID=155978 RepID=UPI0005A066A1|nr:DUF3596 domain-containing protein [Acaryochloris marina]